MKKYRFKQVCNMFNVSEETLVRWINKKYIDFSFDGKIYFNEFQIKEFKDKGKKLGFQKLK